MGGREESLQFHLQRRQKQKMPKWCDSGIFLAENVTEPTIALLIRKFALKELQRSGTIEFDGFVS
jgi:hypothetical protein